MHMRCCMFMHVFSSTHKVVGITTLSRADHLTAQTREYDCVQRNTSSSSKRYCTQFYCLSLLKWLISGLHVVEVAHDFQQQIKKYVVEKLNLLNSYDTWHGI